MAPLAHGAYTFAVVLTCACVLTFMDSILHPFGVSCWCPPFVAASVLSPASSAHTIITAFFLSGIIATTFTASLPLCSASPSPLSPGFDVSIICDVWSRAAPFAAAAVAAGCHRYFEITFPSAVAFAFASVSARWPPVAILPTGMLGALLTALVQRSVALVAVACGVQVTAQHPAAASLRGYAFLSAVSGPMHAPTPMPHPDTAQDVPKQTADGRERPSVARTDPHRHRRRSRLRCASGGRRGRFTEAPS
eukprot:TRINITY_DN24371_c0_g1_i1.p1 TRINITY_DN24371_c0_g1~~TRINITY_DN24371_c0_g1_i1.p1  ORF type:complete len:250 (-),score=10.31 TRINITY_DN24371_c0_g1_i1:56-805(-)